MQVFEPIGAGEKPHLPLYLHQSQRECIYLKRFGTTHRRDIVEPTGILTAARIEARRIKVTNKENPGQGRGSLSHILCVASETNP